MLNLNLISIILLVIIVLTTHAFADDAKDDVKLRHSDEAGNDEPTMVDVTIPPFPRLNLPKWDSAETDDDRRAKEKDNGQSIAHWVSSLFRNIASAISKMKKSLFGENSDDDNGIVVVKTSNSGNRSDNNGSTATGGENGPPPSSSSGGLFGSSSSSSSSSLSSSSISRNSDGNNYHHRTVAVDNGGSGDRSGSHETVRYFPGGSYRSNSYRTDDGNGGTSSGHVSILSSSTSN